MLSSELLHLLVAATPLNGNLTDSLFSRISHSHPLDARVFVLFFHVQKRRAKAYRLRRKTRRKAVVGKEEERTK
jgi:hypothetical protein